MKAIYDSILLNRLQMESTSNEVIINCFVVEDGFGYETDIVLNHSSLNQLMSELSVRGLDFNFDELCNETIMKDGQSIIHLDFSKEIDRPLYLPLYCIPEQVRLMRA